MYKCQCCHVPEGGFHHSSCSNQNVINPLGDIVINPGHNLRDRDKVIADLIRKLRGMPAAPAHPA
jgi:hypothetical protein